MQCSLEELSLADNPSLCLDVVAAERLAAALPRLRRLALSAAPELGSQGAAEAHVAGVVRLLQLLGPRVQLLR